jgi:hypothetical protein
MLAGREAPRPMISSWPGPPQIRSSREPPRIRSRPPAPANQVVGAHSLDLVGPSEPAKEVPTVCADQPIPPGSKDRAPTRRGGNYLQLQGDQ